MTVVERSTGPETAAVAERIRRFSGRYGRELDVGGLRWRYYRLGHGPAVFWLTGGLRRAALGFGFMERLGERRTVVAPDYPPVRSVDEMTAGFDAILRAEGVVRFALGGQSYGGLLAQVFLAGRPSSVERLILSSTGPADYGRAWLPVERLAILLARTLPERRMKALLAEGLVRFIASEAERGDWAAVVHDVLERELTRADVVSHFAVAADWIRRDIVRPSAYAAWPGRVVVLAAENDPTQGKGDRARFEALFGRPVEVVSLGTGGHAALLLDPARYAEVVERALA